MSRSWPQPPTLSAPRLAFVGLALSMLLSSLGTSIANVALPTLSQAFAAPFAAVQWVVLAYLLTSTAAVVSVGYLGDRYGRRRLLLGGLGCFTAAALAAAVAPTLGSLIVARAAQGVAAAFLMALALALTGALFPRERLGSAMGFLGSMSAVGTALGPSLGGFLISVWGWPAIFAVQVPMGLGTFLLVRRFLPIDHPRAAPDRTPPSLVAPIDWRGLLLMTATLVPYSLAMTLGRGAWGPLNWALLAAAGVGALAFGWVEIRSAAPLVPLTLFLDPTRRQSLVLNLTVSAVLMATLVVGPFFLAGALGLHSTQVGLAMTVGPLVAALSGIPAGRWVDRFGAARLTTVALAIIAAGTTSLAVVPTFALLGYLLPIAVITAGYGLFQSANPTAFFATAPAEQRGVLAGLLNLTRNLGLITGASWLAAVFAYAAGTPALATASPAALRQGLRFTFAVASLAMVVALAWRLWGQRAKNAPTSAQEYGPPGPAAQPVAGPG